MYELVNYLGEVKASGLTKDEAEARSKDTGYKAVTSKKAKDVPEAEASKEE